MTEDSRCVVPSTPNISEPLCKMVLIPTLHMECLVDDTNIHQQTAPKEALIQTRPREFTARRLVPQNLGLVRNPTSPSTRRIRKPTPGRVWVRSLRPRINSPVAGTSPDRLGRQRSRPHRICERELRSKRKRPTDRPDLSWVAQREPRLGLKRRSPSEDGTN